MEPTLCEWCLNTNQCTGSPPPIASVEHVDDDYNDDADDADGGDHDDGEPVESYASLSIAESHVSGAGGGRRGTIYYCLIRLIPISRKEEERRKKNTSTWNLKPSVAEESERTSTRRVYKCDVGDTCFAHRYIDRETGGAWDSHMSVYLSLPLSEQLTCVGGLGCA